MAADTPPADNRATELRRYVELDALEDILRNIMMFLREDPKGPFREVGWDDISIEVDKWTGTGKATSVNSIYESRWPADKEEFSVDAQLANAQSSALVSQIFAELATEEGREALLEIAARFAGIAGNQVANAYELIEAT
jgi:hypothetical protein